MTKTILMNKNNEYLTGNDFIYDSGKFISACCTFTKDKSNALVVGKVEAKERIKIARKYCNIELFEEIVK